MYRLILAVTDPRPARRRAPLPPRRAPVAVAVAVVVIAVVFVVAVAVAVAVVVVIVVVVVVAASRPLPGASCRKNTLGLSLFF